MDRSVCLARTVALTNQIRNRWHLSAISGQPRNILDSALSLLVATLRCVFPEFHLNLIFLVQAKPSTK
jgi:hypothetical protein